MRNPEEIQRDLNSICHELELVNINEIDITNDEWYAMQSRKNNLCRELEAAEMEEAANVF